MTKQPFYIFLDFDGPVFNETCEQGDPAILSEIGIHPFFKYWRMDQRVVEILNKSVFSSLYEPVLVISSSWADARMHTKEQIVSLLEKNQVGLPLAPGDAWKTPRLQKFWIRAQQIAYWLELYAHKSFTNNYLVLDDPASGTGLTTPREILNNGLLLENVLLSDPDIGFSTQELSAIEKRLLGCFS